MRQADPIQLHYARLGSGDPLLLIHGLGSSTRDWEHQVPVLARQYQLLIPDLRGHGRSPKPPGPYSLPLFAGDLDALIHALALPPVHVVGLSLGGFVAFQLAIDHPERVRSLVVVNAVAELPRKRWQDRLRVASALWLRRQIVRRFGMRALGQLLSRQLFPRPDQAALRQTFVDRWAENQPAAYLAALDAIDGWSVADRLQDIRVPTCLIAGEGDFIPMVLKEDTLARLPHGELIRIPGSGHCTPMDAPERFNQSLLAFLGQRS